jgi:hypothetical protein
VCNSRWGSPVGSSESEDQGDMEDDCCVCRTFLHSSAVWMLKSLFN